ncbi:MAG: PilN domain-containing protein [Phycisphaerae bacterium]|jgi:hypothetical protein
MTPEVNLLPASYRAAKVRRRRVRIGAAAACVLLGLELFGGLFLHIRAGRVRDLLGAATEARNETRLVRQKMKAPAQESAQLSQQLALARRLRTTHHWSRLLGVFAQAAADRTTLTAVSTDPPKWTPNLGAAEVAAARPDAKSDIPRVIEGLTVRGCAADHDDVSGFVSRLQAARAFASVNVLEVRRDKYLEKDVISFEIRCRW